MGQDQSIAFVVFDFGTADPEKHSQWSQFYASALPDALRKTNNRRKETLDQMNQNDWRLMVTREMLVDMWYASPAADEGSYVTHSERGPQ